jgi:hypothetical protein
MNEELKQSYAAALHRAIDSTLLTEPSNSEPVAWMVKAPNGEYLAFENTEHPVMADCEYIPLYIHPAKTLTDEEINVVAILQDAEIVPVGHEIWKTGEEFNKYKKIVLATAKALRKAQEK